jgi:hypothetical protein
MARHRTHSIEFKRQVAQAPGLRHVHPAELRLPRIRVGSGNLDTGHRWIFGLNAA